MIGIRYSDGTEHVIEVDNSLVTSWWMPQDFFKPHARVAWRGKNKKCPNIAVFLCGINNPHPDREISEIRLATMPGAGKWFVLGVTLCNAPVYLSPNPITFGIPDDWGAAAVVYALVEGLAGVKDTGVAFNKALLAPRWESASIKEADATIKYEASGGYVCYRYRRAGKKLNLEFTGSGEQTQVEILLPSGSKARAVSIDGRDEVVCLKQVETSDYLTLKVDTVGVHRVEVLIDSNK